MASYNIYIGIGPEILDFGARWDLLVVNPNGHSCIKYTSTGGPHIGATIYQRSRMENKNFFQQSYVERLFVGSISEEKLRAFETVFAETAPGPSQFFVLRVFCDVFAA
ncbi:uncharacterized protein BJX67DRAFT_380727 [Aspergillus lucknowensis]|uniref:Uncharacterized protein n=1 Tax=Aspergillus lucknowensis TaxID=176173 RepID=A0ABR4LTB4_9EURO